MPLVHRSARAVAVFAVSLLGFMALSQEFVLPALLSMRLPGATLTPAMVVPRKQALEEELTTLDGDRSERLLDRDPLHVALRSALVARTTSARDWSMLLGNVRDAVPAPATLVLSRVVMDNDTHTFVLEGEISSPEAGTMTLLARLGDKLTALPGIRSVDMPAFTRTQRPDGIFVTPFTITAHAS